MEEALILLYVFGFIFTAVTSLAIGSGQLERCPLEGEPKIKYKMVRNSLLAPFWIITVPLFGILYCMEQKREAERNILKKEVQIMLCPECEKKFLTE